MTDKPYKHIIEIQTNNNDLRDTIIDMLTSFFDPKYITIRVENNKK